MIAGRYSLDREIGHGGMGAVWLGRDEVLGRRVALKRIGLLPGADRTDLARAEREARLSARLNHPHVVSVFDVVVDPETEAHWLVMEYVEGRDLGQLVREQGRLSPHDAAPLLWQVADALVGAHAAGIAHRDVKPSNVLVDESGSVKLTDFGIARLAADPALTQTGLLTGSPAYLAPEVATGGPSGEAADVWSLGATLFHVLAGRPPYDMGSNVLAGLYRTVHEEPPRLDDAGWLAPLLEATMVRDPAARWSMSRVRDYLAGPPDRVYPTAAGLSIMDDPGERTTVLPEALRPSPPAAAPAPTPAAAYDRGGRSGSSRRRPLALLLGVLALLAVVAVIAGVVLAGRDSGDQTASPGGSSGPTRTPSSSATPSESPSSSPSSSPSPSRTPAAVAKPTAQGMTSFIRDYVRTTGEDPSRSWQMLTPKFQRESGGFATYRSFWDRATNGRVLSIQANPQDLTVSYQVRFDDFDNGPGPTVLDLAFRDGTYKIDGESSQGFTPAG